MHPSLSKILIVDASAGLWQNLMQLTRRAGVDLEGFLEGSSGRGPLKTVALDKAGSVQPGPSDSGDSELNGDGEEAFVHRSKE